MKNSSYPLWLTIVSAFFIVWNFMGLFNFYAQMTISDQDLYNMPAAEQTVYTSYPLWTAIAFGVAVIAGFLGCIALLFRKKAANLLLQFSLVGVLVQMYHSLFIANALDVYGPGHVVMPIMIIGFAVLLVWLSSLATKEGWIK